MKVSVKKSKRKQIYVLGNILGVEGSNKLVHVIIMEAKKSHDVPSEIGDSEKMVV